MTDGIQPKLTAELKCIPQKVISHNFSACKHIIKREQRQMVTISKMGDKCYWVVIAKLCNFKFE